MVNDEDNRWLDEDLRDDAMEKMFNSKKRRNMTSQITSDMKEQPRLSKNHKNQDAENLNVIVIEQNQKSNTKERLNFPSDYPYPKSIEKSIEDSGQKLENDVQTLKSKEKTQTSIIKMQNDKTPETITKSDLKDIKHLLEDIVTVIRETYGYKKYPYDEKSRGAMEEGVAMVYKYRNYYDITNTIKVAGPVDPNDFDSPVYNKERIFEDLERYSDIINVSNDGRETLFVVVSHGGRTNFSKEAPIFPGEVKTYYHIYEIRLRSPQAGLQYRVTEYGIMDVSESPLIPIELAIIQDESLPSADTSWLSGDISPSRSPTTFRIQVSVSVEGILSAVIKREGNEQVVILNATSGPELLADVLYIFEILVHEGDSVNFRYSVSGGNIKVLRVQEIDSAVA